jgi:hypothetical protein
MSKRKPESTDIPDWYTTLTEGQTYLFTEVTSMIYVGRLVRIDGPQSASRVVAGPPT